MQSRRLTAAERDLATSVFGSAIALDSVRLVAAPLRGMAVTLGSHVLFPRDVIAGIRDFTGQPLPLRVWFIHELAHVWQFQRRPLWTLASWLTTLLGGGYGPRRRGYRLPESLVWKRLNLEQQAEVIAGTYRLAQTGEGDDAAGDRLCACLHTSGLHTTPSRN